MAMYTETCRVCSTSTQHEEDDFWTEDHYDPNVPGMIDLKAIGLGDALGPVRPVVCSDCARDLERKFARPIWATGRTLGDDLIDGFEGFLETIEEALDQQHFKEVLPISSGSLARPALERSERRDAELGKVLARIGAPLCIAIPEWVEEEDGDGFFLLAGLSDASPGSVYYNQACWHMVLDRHGSLNAYEYAPDGTPLRPNQG
jgi:hypothetical protein